MSTFFSRLADIVRMTANQIEFVNLIIDHVTEGGIFSRALLPSAELKR